MIYAESEERNDKKEFMDLVGKKSYCLFKKNKEQGISGILGYADEFSDKHDYHKTGYFYIANTSFKVSHIRKW